MLLHQINVKLYEFMDQKSKSANSDFISFGRGYWEKENIDDSKWNNFRWQLQNRVTNLSQLENHLNLSNKERNGVILSGNKLSLSITPHFFNLIEANNPLPNSKTSDSNSR